MTRREIVNLLALGVIATLSVLPTVLYQTVGQIDDFWFDEKGLFETVAAFACLIMSGALFYTAFRSSPKPKPGRRFMLIGFALVLLFLGGEELNWGQQIYRFKTPEIISDNSFQKSFSIHNSKWIQSKNNYWSRQLMGWLKMYLIFFPVILFAFPSLTRLAERLFIPIPSLVISITTFLIVRGNDFNYRNIYGNEYQSDYFHIGECFESLIEICLCWVALEFILKYRSTEKLT